MEKIKQQGFTLIELLVTIAVVAILASIAVPAFKTMVINNRIEATANRLRNTFIQTRNKAIDAGADQHLTAAQIADKKSVMVDISRNNGSGDIVYAADGTLSSTDLVHIVFSICYDGSATGIREKAVVLYPSGLASVKGESQLVVTAGDQSDSNETLQCGS